MSACATTLALPLRRRISFERHAILPQAPVSRFLTQQHPRPGVYAVVNDVVWNIEIGLERYGGGESYGAGESCV